MSARTAMREARKEQMQKQSLKFFAEEFVTSKVVPLIPELSHRRNTFKWTVEIVRAKGTGRMTLRYNFGNSLRIYAKVYTDELGESSYRDHRYLWEIRLAQEPTYLVPEPLGFIESDNLLLMRSVEGIPLASLLISKQTERALNGVRAAARWLISLHKTAMPFIPVEPPCERIKIFKLADMLGKASAAYPERASLLLDLLQQIRKVAPSGSSLRKPVPTHGQYTPSNVFLNLRVVTVIDLDRLCLSDPAKDVAIFIHRMKSMSFKATGDAQKAEQFAQAFVEEYRKIAPENLSNLSYYRALYCLKGYAKFAKDQAPGDPERKSVEGYYLAEFQRCLNT